MYLVWHFQLTNNPSASVFRCSPSSEHVHGISETHVCSPPHIILRSSLMFCSAQFLRCASRPSRFRPSLCCHDRGMAVYQPRSLVSGRRDCFGLVVVCYMWAVATSPNVAQNGSCRNVSLWCVTTSCWDHVSSRCVCDGWRVQFGRPDACMQSVLEMCGCVC